MIRARAQRPVSARGVTFAVLISTLTCACVARPAVIDPVAAEAAVFPAAPEVIDVLTYNVAGLPAVVAKVDGRETHPRIGPAIRDFDLVLLQEDFWYHDLIDAPHAWQVRPRRGEMFRLGDGLARFSNHPLGPVDHVPWETAHGWFSAYNDRLAWKGFAVGQLWIDDQTWLWVYNVHFDAGGQRGDREAREHQREQLIEDIQVRTRPDEPLIVAGDFNTGSSGLEDFRARTGLSDCGVGGIDRILYRSGTALSLRVNPKSTRPEPDLGELRGLSDHGALWIRFGVGRGAQAADELLEVGE